LTTRVDRPSVDLGYRFVFDMALLRGDEKTTSDLRLRRDFRARPLAVLLSMN